MKSLLDDVRAFHVACDVPVLSVPTIPPDDRVDLRYELINEEVNAELLPAIAAGDLPEIADAMADAIYVIVGTALEYDIPLDLVWDAVQKANMAKVDPVTGKVTRRHDGKILKSDGWTKPDVNAILESLVAKYDPDKHRHEPMLDAG